MVIEIIHSIYTAVF